MKIFNTLLILICFSPVLHHSLAFSSPKNNLPPVISAVLSENKELYIQEMNKLLKKPVTEFFENIFYTTNQGNTIFHFMAGVQSHQEFFTNEMQVLSYSVIPKKGTISLADSKIVIPNSKDIAQAQLFQQIKSEDFKGILSSLSILKSSPAIEWFQFLYATAVNNKSVKDILQDLYIKRNVSPMREKLRFLSKNQSLQLKEKLKELKPYLKYFADHQSETSPITKNKINLTPKDIAYELKNEPAYYFLSDYSAKRTTQSIFSVFKEIGEITGMVLGIIIVEQLGFSAYPISPIQPTEPQTVLDVGTGISALLIGGVTGGILGKSCHNLFRNKKLNKHFKQ